MTTSKNKVDYYVGDSFIKYYKTASAIKDVSLNLTLVRANN